MTATHNNKNSSDLLCIYSESVCLSSCGPGAEERVNKRGEVCVPLTFLPGEGGSKMMGTISAVQEDEAGEGPGKRGTEQGLLQHVDS